MSEGRTSSPSANMAPAIDRAQERIGAPPSPETPLGAFAGMGIRRLGENVICELDDARA